MSRNGVGTYSLPSNTWNPATPGVAMLSDDWNATASDLATALTQSLAYDGQTTATARIPFAQGISVSAGDLATPSFAATGDLDTGIYFPAANQMTGVCGGVAVWVATSTTLTFPLATTFSAAVTFSDALTVTGAFTANGNIILGNAGADTLTVNATGTFAGNQTFNGTATFTSTVTVPDASFTNAKLANMATQTIKGRTTAGSGAPEDLTATQATAILTAFTGDSGSGGVKGLVPAPASGDAAARKVLAADGTWQNTELKAWAVYDGLTPAAIASRNLTPSRSSTGVYVFTFGTAMPNTNYAVFLTYRDASAKLFVYVTAKTTTDFTILCETATSTATNVDEINAQVIA